LKPKGVQTNKQRTKTNDKHARTHARTHARMRTNAPTLVIGSNTCGIGHGDANEGCILRSPALVGTTAVGPSDHKRVGAAAQSTHVSFGDRAVYGLVGTTAGREERETLRVDEGVSASVVAA
jgi:hypothetical protein